MVVDIAGRGGEVTILMPAEIGDEMGRKVCIGICWVGWSGTVSFGPHPNPQERISPIYLHVVSLAAAGRRLGS